MWLAALTTLTATPSLAEGFVLVMRGDGSFVSHSEWQSQSKIAFKGRLPKAEPVAAPHKQVPSAEVGKAISKVGMRYASSQSLRAADLSVTEWLALFRANIEIESAYRPGALSHVGAIGLGQLMPATAKELGVDPHVMEQNLDGSARYLLGLLGDFGKPELALAAYNAGPNAVTKYGGIPPFKETQGHVRKVMAVWQRIKKEGV